MLFLALLVTLLVKGLPVLALLWGIVLIVNLYEHGILTPSRARRPRQGWRVVVLRFGNMTLCAGVQYA